jgi:MFS family permease
VTATMETAPPVDKAALIDGPTRRRALFGSAVGSAVEWYDYFLYGTMSALVFGPLFFPSDDAVSSQMLSLASFALAFLIRPIGGVIFSHIGDRIGRKRTLVITLSMMGVATVAIGLMPTYAQIGIWAPILLTVLRLIQGLALGGEWGGGLLMAVEYAPKNKRGLYGAVPQTGALFGLAIGNLAASAASGLFSEADFLAFGWRIPFIFSIVLVAVGLWIRNKVAETPSFTTVVESNTTAKVPLFTTLRYHWKAVLITIGAKFIETSTFFIFATFTVSYAVGLGFARNEALNAVLIAAVVAIPVMLAVGSISDRVGRKKMFIAGAILVMIYIVPYFWLINQKSFLLLAVAVTVGFGVIWSMYGAVLGTFFAESYSADVRYTGVSLGYQIGAALVGGPAPLIATALLAGFNQSYLPVGLFVIACGIVSLVAVSLSKDRSGQPLD